MHYIKAVHQWYKSSIQPPKYSRHFMARRSSRKENYSQAHSKGKLLKILWFIPAKIIEKLSKVKTSSLSDLEDELV
jgi:hypothetical protein